MAVTDPDVLCMMADLGLDRRDRVSAPEEAKGRACAVDERKAVAAAAEFEARKTRSDTAPTTGEDPRAARLRAWNTQSSFEEDTITAQLENRFSGQGHRAALNRNFHREEREDSVLNRHGEERDLYLREKAREREESTNSRSPQRDGDRAVHRPFSGHGNLSTPPRLPGAYEPGGRDRVAMPSRTPGRDRASSPSRHGTVIFGPGGQRHVASSGRSMMPRQSLAVQPVAPRTATPRPAVNGTTTPSSTTIQPQSTPAGPSTPRHTSTQAQQYHNQALWYAANPGQLCDGYHEKFPDRQRYLGPARDKFIKEAVVLVDSDNEQQLEDYLETHRDRQWMIQAAKLAMSQIETGNEAAIEEYCVDHPRQRFFLRIAKAFYAAKNKASTTNNEMSSTPAVSAQAAPQPSSSHAAPTVHKHASSDTSSDGAPSHSSDIADSGEISTAPSSPPTSLGLIATTFFDAAGKFLGFHHVATSVPVQMTINLISRNAGFSPCDLTDYIDALAHSMESMSNGSADDGLRRIDSLAGNMVDAARGSKKNRKLEGATLGDDGLWVIDEL